MEPSCLTDASFNFVLGECTVNKFVTELATTMKRLNGCSDDPWEELLSFFDVNSDSEVRDKIEEICDSAYAAKRIPFNQLMVQEKQFTEEFFDGGNEWNYEVDEGNGGANLVKDAGRIKVISDQLLASRPSIGFPEAHNFEGCKLRTAMCCYVGGRNAGGEPDDNSDACYMEFAKARQSSHVRDGYSIYSGNGNEGPLNCHGFAWGDDSGYGDAAFKGNTLFQVAMKHALYEEGDVEELPGAPMCGCIEQMPVVTRADCTETIVTQSVSIQYNPTLSQFVAEASVQNIQHTNCGDLSSHYDTLVSKGKASATEKALLEKHLVGNQCRAAQTDFLKTKGFEFA